jgi:hypothetical protein
MLLYVAIVLAIMSVVMWRIEAQAFLHNLEQAMLVRTTPGKVWTVVKSLPSLAPLVIDIVITSSLITMFGLAGGVTGAAMALAMSNTASIFIARQAVRMRTMAQPPKVNACQPHAPTPYQGPTIQYPEFVHAYNRGFFAVMRRALNAFEHSARPREPRRCAPCHVPR